jgi:Flp pilus assembly protein TadB
MEVAMEPIPSERSSRAFGGWTVTRTDSIRVGDRERDAAATALAQHYAQGRLTAAEHEERMTRALKARTNADLDALFRDLPRFDSPRPQPASRRRSHPALRVLLAVVAAMVAFVVVLNILAVLAIVGLALILTRVAFGSNVHRPRAVGRRGWHGGLGCRGW